MRQRARGHSFHSGTQRTLSCSQVPMAWEGLFPSPLHLFRLYSQPVPPGLRKSIWKKWYPLGPGNVNSPGVWLFRDFWVTCINMNCLYVRGAGVLSKQLSHPIRDNKRIPLLMSNKAPSSCAVTDCRGLGAWGWEGKKGAWRGAGLLSPFQIAASQRPEMVALWGRGRADFLDSGAVTSLVMPPSDPGAGWAHPARPGQGLRERTDDPWHLATLLWGSLGQKPGSHCHPQGPRSSQAEPGVRRKEGHRQETSGLCG